MKMYVGIAKAVPDSLTPRRFIVIRNDGRDDRQQSPRGPAAGRCAAAAYCAADEIDTATVRT